MMFKRFLKFFRREEDAPSEPFEGSYLDHLLAQVQPEVVEQLKECDDHDPLLLVVVAILRLTMMNEWSPVLRTPLLDSQSPGPRPPAPPAGIDDQVENITTDEFDAIQIDDDDSDVEEINEISDAIESESKEPQSDDQATDDEPAAADELSGEEAEADADEDEDEAEKDDQTLEDLSLIHISEPTRLQV